MEAKEKILIDEAIEGMKEDDGNGVEAENVNMAMQ